MFCPLSNLFRSRDREKRSQRSRCLKGSRAAPQDFPTDPQLSPWHSRFHLQIAPQRTTSPDPRQGDGGWRRGISAGPGTRRPGRALVAALPASPRDRRRRWPSGSAAIPAELPSGSRSWRRDPGKTRRLAGGVVVVPAAGSKVLVLRRKTKLRPMHEPLWRDLGILEGIVTSTYRVRRGSEGALLQLVPFWSPETNTFVFPWGEATVTLEDVAVLAGLPLVGFPVREPLVMEEEHAVGAVRRLLNQSKSTKWAEHFFLRRQRRPVETAAEGGGRDDEELLEHGTFLSLWLSRFVLPSPPFGAVPGEEVIPIAVRLARGQSVALAPAALASIYSDLSALKRHFVGAKRTEAPPPSVSAPMHILHLWVWERFPEVRPATAAAGIPADSAGGDVPRAARWHDVVGKALEPGYVHSVFTAPKQFEWRPYGSRALLSFARCLHPCELVGMGSIEQHNPHRVARQLGFDQDVPGIVARLNSDSWEKAWETYDVGAGCYASAVPSCDKPGVTDEYVQWWKPSATSTDKVHKEILDDQNKNERGTGDILTLNKEFGSLLEDSVEARKRGSAIRESSSSRLAEGNNGLGSSEVCTKTLYYLRASDRPKEAWAKDDANNSTGAGRGFFQPKRAVGTTEMIQKASEKRQAEIAALRIMIEKQAKEIQEAEAAEAPKK